MIGPLGRLAVRLAYEVAQEWRRLDGRPVTLLPDGEMSCTMSTVERAPTWDFDRQSPAAKRIGFGK